MQHPGARPGPTLCGREDGGIAACLPDRQGGPQRMAGGPGIEPGFTDPKSVVLPLDDPPNQEITLPSLSSFSQDL